jgi:DNA-directed RNA polymerase specialized sigma24 family protein
MKYPLKAEDYNMSCQEIADRLGWSLSIVETLQQRAIVKLRKCCKERGIKFTDLVENLSK